jgi:hypothetical protein
VSREIYDSWTKRNIEQRLVNDLNVAAEAFRLASRNLNEIVKDIPSGSSSSDATIVLKQAHGKCTQTFEAWRQAAQRWQDFVMKGKVPEEFTP